MLTAPEMVMVPVEGGDLAVARWGGTGPVVVAAHGITANHTSWTRVAEQLAGDAQLVAPDLRGRGASSGLPGPSSMAGHARDLVAVLDHFGVDRGVVVGHSMGGYVTVVMAHRHPERVHHALLVDGGIPLPLREGITVDEALDEVVGPAVARLSMRFATREAYHDFFRAHPALGPYWDELIEAYLDYDLTGEEPELRSRVDPDLVRDDAADSLIETTILDAVAEPKVPMSIVRAERGMFDQVPGLFPDDLVARYPQVRDLGKVPDVNHYTVAFATHGAAALADAIRAVL